MEWKFFKDYGRLKERMLSLKCLYFPGESWDPEIEDTFLKKCLLFFDKTYAIVPDIFAVNWRNEIAFEELNPLEQLARQGKLHMMYKLMKSSKKGMLKLSEQEMAASRHELARHFRIQNFLDKIAFLRKNGIIEIVDPRENLVDPPYWKSSEPIDWHEISMLYEEALRNRLVPSKLEECKPLILYGGILKDLKDQSFRKIVSNMGQQRVVVYKGQAEFNWLSNLGEYSGFPEDKMQQWPSTILYYGSPGTVSTPMWAALIINHVILTSHRYNLIPITPHRIFWKLFQSKLQRLWAFFQDNHFNQTQFAQSSYKDVFKAFQITLCTLPDFELYSFEDVLELRERLKDELIAFRKELLDFSRRIKAEPWESEIISEINYQIENFLKPAVNELQRRLTDVPKRAVFKSINVSTGLSIVASIWVGMPPLLLAAVIAGLVPIQLALQCHYEKNKIFQCNGLSFFLQFPDTTI